MLMPRWSPRRGLVLLTAVVVATYTIWDLGRRVQARQYFMSPGLSFEYAQVAAQSSGHVLPASVAPEVCKLHGFREFSQKRKVYDLVMFSTELDWLEIRLHSHVDWVDYFVIIESPTTFSGKPKPLVLKDNWDRFKEFHDKIIYRTVEDLAPTRWIWDHEAYLRNSMLKEVFPSLSGAQAASSGDALVVADMDELLRPGTLLLLRHCDFPTRLTLRSRFYYYSFQWRHRGKQWAHPEATVFGSSVANTLPPHDLRLNLLGPGFPPLSALRRLGQHGTLWDAGWHCSSCFATVAEMQTKMESFSHQELNTPENRDADALVERVKQGLDLFGREGEFYDRVDENDDVPEYLKREYDENGRFAYLLNRDGEDAAFEDWENFKNG